MTACMYIDSKSLRTGAKSKKININGNVYY